MTAKEKLYTYCKKKDMSQTEISIILSYFVEGQSEAVKSYNEGIGYK